jgi:hypothetical protein
MADTVQFANQVQEAARYGAIQETAYAMELKQVLFELAMASITAGLDYLQLIRLKEAAGKDIRWEDVDAAIERNETNRARFERTCKGQH